MPIPIQCDCGKSMRVKDDFAGRKIRCPACTTVIAVPRPEVEPSVEDEALDIFLTELPQDKALPKPSKDEEEATTQTTDKPPAPKPKAIPKKRLDPMKAGSSSRSERSRRSMPSFSINPNIITGLSMMAIALIWFFGALALGILFYYPPILFVLGMATMIRGFFGQED